MSRKLFRSRDDKRIAGICGGLSEFTGINSSVFRLIFAVLSLTGAAGIIIYLILYYVIPLRPENHKPGYTYVDATYEVEDEK